ncbi:MAG: imidazolonepropionase, partial [Acidobacteriota bacterium]
MTCAPGAAGLGLVEDGALAVRDGRIAWLGPEGELSADAGEILDLRGRLITPGLIDCHTHLVWGGDRSREFEQRLEGVGYEEIARGGGGINASVAATRGSSEDELFRSARRRLESLMAGGVTTVEIKSGYGLDLETEARMLRVARRLGRELPVRVRATFLGAHAVPPEFAGRSDAYMDLVANEMLPALAADGLVDAVDAFCEGIAFAPDQVERLFAAARTRGLPIKVHAEQLSLLGGALLAARLGALSADHLEDLDEAGARALAESGTAAVLLPGAYFFLRETQAPPVEL